MSFGRFIRGYMEGANYRRLKQSLASQRATQQNTDDMLRLAMAGSESERRKIASAITAEREMAIAAADVRRRANQNLLVVFDLIVAAVVGFVMLPASIQPSPASKRQISVAAPYVQADRPAGSPVNRAVEVLTYGTDGDHGADMYAGMGDRAIDAMIADCRSAKAHNVTVAPSEYANTLDRMVQDKMIGDVQDELTQRGMNNSYTYASSVLSRAAPKMKLIKDDYDNANMVLRHEIASYNLTDTCPDPDASAVQSATQSLTTVGAKRSIISKTTYANQPEASAHEVPDNSSYANTAGGRGLKSLHDAGYSDKQIYGEDDGLSPSH